MMMVQSGQRFIEEEVFVMERAISEFIKPKLDYQLHILKLNQKKGVAVFSVNRSENRPHFLIGKIGRRLLSG